MGKYGEFPIYKIACGANDDDYDWTEVLMATAGGLMDGLSLYYTLPTGDWAAKGSAVDFDEPQWYETIRRTRKVATLSLSAIRPLWTSMTRPSGSG